VALSPPDVIAAAVRLLDDVGLQGLTLRRLAAELGVSAPTLYWHVKDKRALLDLVAEQILAADPPPARPAHGQPWWEWLTERTCALYRALISHRDAALVMAGNRPTEASLPALEQTVGSLIEVGFPPGEALDTILNLSHYAIGSAVEYQAEAARSTSAERDAALAVRLRTAEDLPNLVAALRSRTRPDPDATFRQGLGLIMAGLRTRHAELVGVTPAST
jgi:TetR/AcrR family transcriptional regulator, tetracycline repressor protein